MKIISIITLISAIAFADWIAPESAKSLKNPFSNTDEKTIRKGENLYKQLCWTCHGKKGVGDGPAGASLDPKPADFSSEKVQIQTDGEIFWKITNGRKVMPTYEDLLSEKQRWQLVTFIRNLKQTK